MGTLTVSIPAGLDADLAQDSDRQAMTCASRRAVLLGAISAASFSARRFAAIAKLTPHKRRRICVAEVVKPHASYFYEATRNRFS